MDDGIDQSNHSKSNWWHTAAPLIGGAFFNAVILLWLLLTHDPAEGGPRLVLGFLATVFVLLFFLFALVIQLTGHIFKTAKGFSWYRILYGATVLSFGFVFLLGLQTLGQLRLIDVALVGLFEVVVNFYILRRF